MTTHTSTLLPLLTTFLFATSSTTAGDIYVDVNTGDDNNNGGTEWDDAFATLSRALVEADEQEEDYDIIWVAEGTYLPGDDRGDTFSLVNNTWVLGGFKGPEGDEEGEGDRSERNPAANETILSGDLDEDDDQEIFTDNSFIVVTAPQNDGDTFIDGFTIRGGNLDEDGPDDIYGGAGMRVYVGTGPAIIRCIFTENHASDAGQADRLGGALWIGAVSGGTPEDLEDLPKVIDCEFVANSVDGDGGGLGTTSVAPLVYNSLFFDNDAADRGGAAGGWGASFVNCTIVENGADTTGGVIGAGFGGSLDNCIVWGNTDSGGNREEKQIDGYSPSRVEYTTVMNCSTDNDPPGYGICSAHGGEGNNDDPPQFIGSGNFRLQSGSPARDSGTLDVFQVEPGSGILRDVFKDVLDINADSYQEELTPDLDLVTRILGGNVDRGAYETSGACRADTDSDGDVDFADLLNVLDDWGPCQLCPTDFNDDGEVDFTDLLLVLATWGPCAGALEPNPEPRQDVWDSMGLDGDDWALFMQTISSGTTAEKDNHRCWVDHYYYAHFLRTCFCSPNCPDDDPYAQVHLPPP